MTEELEVMGNDRLLCVKVGKIKRENIYEMARKYWKVDGRRAQNSTYVLAIIDGIVDTVFVDCIWKPTENQKYIGRWEFRGKISSDSPYIGKSVKSYYGHSVNPVKYINM